MSASKKIAIVTGGSKGIGAEVCRRLAADGLGVIVDYSGDPAPADELVSVIEGAGGLAKAVKADVSDPAAVLSLFDAAEELGTLQALVNNAGIMKLSTLAEADDALFDRHVAINLKGVFLGIREAAKRMGSGGRIVSFSSSVVGLYQPTYGIYAATKAGVEAMTHIAAKELGPKGITVNAVAPGPVATSLFLDDKSEEQVEHVKKMIPMGRLAEPQDISAVVSFLVSQDGGWISGQVIRANGGIV